LSDDSSSSLDVAAGSEGADTSLASDLARTAAKDCAVDNVDRLFRAMDQARQVQEKQLGTGPSSTSRYPEYGPEDTVSSSGFFSGSDVSGWQTSTERMRIRMRDTSSVMLPPGMI
uniref:Phosphoprotein n=1 Tax=Echinostoma caproni TaxID=27848 RepID=A0A183BE02_9TREM